MPALTNEQLRQAEYCAGLGLTEEDVAHIIGVTIPQLDRLKRHDPNLLKALAVGRAKAKSAVAQAAYKLAISGKSAPATIFWLKAQAGWSESLPVHKQDAKKADVVFKTRIGERGDIVTEHLESGNK